MGQSKVIATFMHEYELEIALAFINQENRKLTDSFVIGTIDNEKINELKSKGLIVRVLDSFNPITASNLDSLFPNSHFKNLIDPISGIENTSIKEITSIYFKPEDDFYIISITGPLLIEYVEALSFFKIQIIESLSLDSYSVFLTVFQCDEIKRNSDNKFYFISSIRPYNKYDTGIFFSYYKAKPKKNIFNYFFLRYPNLENVLLKKKGILIFDLLLHRPIDLESSLIWLKELQLEIIETSIQKIRIQLSYNKDILNKIAGYKFIKSIEQFVPPKFQNNVAKSILRLESTSGNGITHHIKQTGKDEIIGVADTGIDHHHPDLEDRFIDIVSLGRSATNDTSDPIGHGTHVTGSIVGTGKASRKEIMGVAPDAKVYFQSLIDNNKVIKLPGSLGTLFDQAYTAGARIHNNSWGSETPSTYTILSQDVDQFVHKKKDMLIVISAGNQGTGANPRNVSKGLVDLGSIGAPATAKNALTVGASRSTRTIGGYSTLTYGAKWKKDFPFSPIKNEHVSGNSDCLAAFSSRGPTSTDFRIKPDLVAPGTDIISCKASSAQVHKYWGPYASNPDFYAYMGGTSMAAPLVAGCAALVRQYYRDKINHNPSAALLKATLINGTDRLGGPDALAGQLLLPNYHQGFGLLNMLKTIPNTYESFRLIFKDTWQDIAEQLQNTGNRFRYEFHAKKEGWIRICFAYTDDPALAIQNIIDITLENMDTKQKWIGNADRPEVGPILSNRKQPDNVQIIRLENAKPGKYLLQVSAYTLLKAPQDFAVVITSNCFIDDLQPYHAT